MLSVQNGVHVEMAGDAGCLLDDSPVKPKARPEAHVGLLDADQARCAANAPPRYPQSALLPRRPYKVTQMVLTV